MGIKPRRRVTDLYMDKRGHAWKRADVYDVDHTVDYGGTVIIYAILLFSFLVIIGSVVLELLRRVHVG